MQRAIALLVTLACGPATLAAQQTLVLRNGDRLTGMLTRIDGVNWVFRHAGGELRVPAGDVTGFTAPDPVGVRLSDGSILAAAIVSAGNQLRLTGSDGSSRVVAPADVAAVGDATRLAALRPVRIGYFTPFGRFWGATASLGFSDKTGNSRSRGVAADVEVRRRSPRDRLALKLGVAREESRPPNANTLETTVEKYYGSARVDLFFGPRFFTFASTAQERDQFQDIDLRSSYNAGIGVQILATDGTDLRVNASGGLRRESFSSGGAESNAVAGLGTAFRQEVGPAVLAWTADWAPSLDDVEDFRLVSEVSVTTRVFGGLGFRVASRNEVNNRPRSVGVRKHDMLLTTTLTYSIGR